MPSSVIQRSFAAGELAPALAARADTSKYTQGLRACRNFFVKKEGGVSNRAGLGLVSGCKDDVAGKRLKRFKRRTGSAVLIEVGSGYFRFYVDGAAVNVSSVPAWSAVVNYVPGDIVVQGGVNYYCHAANLNQVPPNATFWYALTGTILEIPTPYGSSDIFQWNQSANVVTITHPGQAPRELVFVSLTRWVLQTISTIPSIAAPVGLAGAAGSAGTRTFSYMVTTAKADTYEESNPSTPFDIVTAGDPTATAPHTLTWTAVVGSAEYYVYCDPYGNGVYGFVGSAATNAFNDIGFVPDFALTPPIPRAMFVSPDDFPTASARFQQRRFFANTNNDPDGVFGSRTGFPSNFGISSPLQDDDAVTFRLAGNDHHAVRFMVATKSGLILFTDGGEWPMTGGGGPKTPLTPTSIDAEQETYVGIDPDVPPVVIGNSVVYAQARGNVVREIQFDQQVEGLAGRDLSIFAAHLLERGKSIVAMDYAQTPDSIVWIVRSDGTLLGLTYIPEQEVWGWHRHDTYTNLPGSSGSAQSLIEEVCVVPEGEEDVVYVIVARVIGGVTKRFIERLESRQIRTGFFNSDCFFVDSGMSYFGAPADVISGLTHLEGQVVAVVADGLVVFNGDPTAAAAATYTVTAGAIELPALASVVHIGLPIRYPEIETLELDAEGTDIRDARKKVGAITLLVDRSSRTFLAGPTASDLRQYAVQAYETGQVTTGPLEHHITADFTTHGRVLIRQPDPLPLTILGVIPNVEIGAD